MTLQIPTTFDRDNVPSMAFLKVLPAEQRGVFHALIEALKSARDVVFRVGGRALDDSQIAQMACENADVLKRVLPELELTCFVQRDQDGALYSPHLVERHIRRAERAAARLEQAQRRAEFETRQAAGEFAPEAGVKAMTSSSNGVKGGRPRKGETPEAARERREQEARQQRELRLLAQVEGGNDGSEKNLTHFSKQGLVLAECQNPPQNQFSVSGDLGLNQVSGFPVDLDIDLKDSLSNSRSTKTEKTKTEKPTQKISEEKLSQTVARVLKIGRLEDTQAGYAKSICGRLMRSGVPADILIEAVKQHAEKMARNGDTAYKMSVFTKPIERFWADHQAGVSTDPLPEPEPLAQWEEQALAAHGKAVEIWNNAFNETRDFSALTREWPDLARKHGLPTCAMEREAYLAFYRPHSQVA